MAVRQGSFAFDRGSSRDRVGRRAGPVRVPGTSPGPPNVNIAETETKGPNVKRPRPILALAGVLAAVLGACAAQDVPASSDDPDSPPPAAARGVVEGTVTGPDGRPVAGAVVTPRSLDTPSRAIPEIAVLTNDQGMYRWTLLPGSYELTVNAEGIVFPARRADVGAGETVTVDFAA